MKGPHEYRLQIVDAGGAPHPDQRLLMLLRMLREFGFILADCEGCQPPAPGLMAALPQASIRTCSVPCSCPNGKQTGGRVPKAPAPWAGQAIGGLSA